MTEIRSVGSEAARPAGGVVPKPGQGEQTQSVTATLQSLKGEAVESQIAALERVHSELANRLNRARA